MTTALMSAGAGVGLGRRADRPRIGRADLLRWLRTEDERVLARLWRRADEVRREHVGDAVHLRGLIEISNVCVRRCLYCGLRAPNRRVARYRQDASEILDCAREAARIGCGTVVLQAGEDPGWSARAVADVVRQIRGETGLAVTLSLGERAESSLALWRAAGADRYLLRFETANPALYARIHPAVPGRPGRLAILRLLRALDYEVGSGIMIGIPGQTYADLVEDILTFRALDLDMIGVGPFIPHPATPLGRRHRRAPAPPAVDQVPASEGMTYKVLALTRLVCPDANIPATTALETVSGGTGRERGLERGANVVMPNVTPPAQRRAYEIYPGKASVTDTAEQYADELMERVLALGRPLGTGPGRAPSWEKRRAAAERQALQWGAP